MKRPSYRIEVGSEIIESGKGPAISLFVEKSMDTPADVFRLRFRGDAASLKRGAGVAIDLGYNGDVRRVFTGRVERVAKDVTSVLAEGYSPFLNLLALRRDETRLSQR